MEIPLTGQEGYVGLTEIRPRNDRIRHGPCVSNVILEDRQLNRFPKVAKTLLDLQGFDSVVHAAAAFSSDPLGGFNTDFKVLRSIT